MLTNTTLNRLGFWVTATGQFQSNPVGVELFSYANTLVGFMFHTEIEIHRNRGE